MADAESSVPKLRKPDDVLADPADLERDAKFLNHIIANEISEVRAMIQEGQNVNVGDDSSFSAVHLAMRHDSDEILAMLIEAGAYVEHRAGGVTPLVFGISLCREKNVSALIASGKVDLMQRNEKTGNTLLHEAAWYGHIEMLHLLFETGVFEDVDQYNGQGKSALHVASFRGTLPIVQELVAKGADPNLLEKNGRRISKESPEDMARSMGKDENADYLKSLSTTVNAVKFAVKMKKTAAA